MKTTAIILTILAFANILQAQIPFESHIITGGELAALGASSVFAADLDGDGDMDVISASGDDNKIAWYEQDEQGNYITHIISTEVDNAQYVYAADLDGDGDVDIISTGWNDFVNFFENDGNGYFTPMFILISANCPGAITTADMDGDGDPDIVLANSDNGIIWHENSDEIFWPVHVVDSAEYHDWCAVDAGDLDGDGDMDIVAAEPGNWGGPGELSLFENTGIDLFVKHEIGGSSCSAFLKDIDGDGDLDIVSSINYYEPFPAWYENTGSLEFTLHQLSEDFFGYGIFAADMDDDGDMDILSSSYSDYNDPVDLIWFENDGSNNFPAHYILENDILYLRSVFACDINLDGDMDVLVAQNDDVLLFDNDGEQDFEEIELTKSAFEASNSVFGDMNGDGNIDIIARYAKTIAWYENNGNQQFTKRVVAEDGGYQNTLSVADLDGDNDLDIVYGQNGTLIGCENNGSGSFSKYTIASGMGSVEDIYIDDLDQDEDLDLLVSSSYFGCIWYENDGGGAFSKHTIKNPESGIHIRGICTADLDNDGDKDILVAKSGAYYAIYYYKNYGNQDFHEFPIWPLINGSAEDVFAGDFDQDGDMDFVYATNTTIYLSSQVGDYSFSGQLLAITDDFSSFYAEDLDMDGDQDIMVTDYASSKLFYLENQGENLFDEYTITEDVRGVMSVCAGDINGDDDMDLITASYHDSKIAWHENLIIGLQTPEFRVPGHGFQVEVYPNPFSEIVHFEFEIQNHSPVSIMVFNAVGEKVADLSVGILAEGKHQIIWKVAHLPAGFYFVRFNAGKENANLKLIMQ